MEKANFFDNSSQLQIQLEQPGNTTSSYSEYLKFALKSMADIIASEVNQIPKENKPSEISVNFSLVASPDGGFIIGLGESTANFKVTMKWGGTQVDSGIASILDRFNNKNENEESDDEFDSFDEEDGGEEDSED